MIAAVDVAGLSYTEATEALGVPVISRRHRGHSRVAAAVGA